MDSSPDPHTSSILSPFEKSALVVHHGTWRGAQVCELAAWHAEPAVGVTDPLICKENRLF
jgi:hypothetical protein